VARARDVIGLDCEEPFERAAARVVEVRSAEVFEHSHGVLDLGDIERLHDMRVATRRLRASLEVFRPCFPRKRYRAALRPLKALADALGERRDRDVAIGFFEGFLEGAPAGDRGRLEILIARLRNEQRQANEDLERFVTEERLADLRGALDDLVEGTRG
jgi:CHAD domain-containing protein